MKAKAGLLGVVIAVLSLWLCNEAGAVFTALDDDGKEVASNEGASVESPTSESSIGSDGHDTVVNPFDDGLRSTMPEDKPAEAVLRSSSSRAHPGNARRFERLLHGEPTPTVEVRRVEDKAATSAAPKRTSTLDYVFGVVVVAGLGAIAVLLFRRHDSS
jgi:hypothetical protein